MGNRTKVIAAAAVTAALAGSGTAAAMASTTSPGTQATTTAAAVSTTASGGKCSADSAVAARLGVSQSRLDQALRAVKTTFIRDRAGSGDRTGSGGIDVSQSQFAAAVAHNLGVSSARVHQAFAIAGRDCVKSGGTKPGDGRSAPSPVSEQRAHQEMAAAVARELHVSEARAAAALAPLFAAGHVEIPSAALTDAARSLGVSAQQLSDALTHAKMSLAGGGPAGDKTGSKTS